MSKSKKMVRLLRLKPTVEPPFVEHSLELSQAHDGTVQLQLYERGEDFPEAFITMSRTMREKLILALQRSLQTNGGSNGD